MSLGTTEDNHLNEAACSSDVEPPSPPAMPERFHHSNAWPRNPRNSEMKIESPEYPVASLDNLLGNFCLFVYINPIRPDMDIHTSIVLFSRVIGFFHLSIPSIANTSFSTRHRLFSGPPIQTGVRALLLAEEKRTQIVSRKADKENGI